MPCKFVPWISSGVQSFPRKLRISAPIWESGVIIRFIGRFWIDTSPLTVDTNGCAARIPDIRRVVVPLFPTSRIESGAFKPLRPRPCTNTLSPLFSISTPILRKQAIDDRQSAPCRNPSTSVLPFAIEPSIILLWEMDLSPGTVTSPESPWTLDNFITFSLSACLILCNTHI